MNSLVVYFHVKTHNMGRTVTVKEGDLKTEDIRSGYKREEVTLRRWMYGVYRVLLHGQLGLEES